MLPVQWSGRKTSRKIYRAMCDIPLDISKDELDRRLEAFGGNYGGVGPMINLHGVRFALAADETAGPAPHPSPPQPAFACAV